jgi:hypothetical protein
VIILAIIVSAFAFPIEKLWEFCTLRVTEFLRYHQRQSTVTYAPSKPHLRARNDEFCDVQTRNAKLLRAARLTKMQCSADYATPHEEAVLVAKRLQEESLLVKFHSFFEVATTANFARQRYGVSLSSTRHIESVVDDARNEAAQLRREVIVLDGSELQEQHLMRTFIVDLFSGHEKHVARRFFLGRKEIKERSYSEMYEQCFGLLMLPASFALMVYFINDSREYLGSRSGDLWLLVALTVFLQKLFFVEPARTWLTWMVLFAGVEAQARDYCESLSKRARLILGRRTGVVQNYNDVIQHFNPACRAARMFPALPISRLLLSINDSDVKLSAVPHAHTWYKWTVLPVLHLLYLQPEVVQDALLNVLCAAVLNFTFLALYFANVFSPVLVAFLVVILVAAALLACHQDTARVWTYILSKFRRNFAIEPVTQEFDFEDEGSFKPLPPAAKIKKEMPVSTRSGMFTEIYTSKLQSGKPCRVTKRAFPFKPLSDIYEMNRRYGVENILDKETAFLGTVGESEEVYKVAEETLLSPYTKKIETEEQLAEEIWGVESPRGPTLVPGGLDQHSFFGATWDPPRLMDDFDMYSVLSAGSPGGSLTGGSLLRGSLDAGSQIELENDTIASPARSLRTTRTARTARTATSAATKYTTGTKRAQKDAQSRKAFTPAAGDHPASISSASRAASRAGPASRAISPLGPVRNRFGGASALSPVESTRPQRSVSTSSYRYRQYALREPRYTDLPGAGPGDASASANAMDIKEEHTGVASPVVATSKQNRTPAYFPRSHRRRHTASDAEELQQVGPGRILAAHETNELPGFPLLY